MTGPCGRLCKWTELNTKTEAKMTFFSLVITGGDFQAGIVASPRSNPHIRQLRHVYGSDSDTSFNGSQH